MRVSVIIAAYNAEAYIAEAVASVLGQTMPPDEAIVIDDGSTDGTRNVLGQFGDRITVLTQDNSGQAVAVNKALATTQGDTDRLLRFGRPLDAAQARAATGAARPSGRRRSRVRQGRAIRQSRRAGRAA